MESKWKMASSPSRKRLFAGNQDGQKQLLKPKVDASTLKPYSHPKLNFPFSCVKNSCRKIDWNPPVFKKQKSKSTSAFEEHRCSLPKADFTKEPKYWKQFEVDECLKDRCNNLMKLDENNDELLMYDDLPFNVRELLNSPQPTDRSMENNIANMKEVGKRQYLAYGTNINGSIWSTDAAVHDNLFNTSIQPAESSGTSLDAKFSSISINSGGLRDSINFNVPWPSVSPSTQNETNDFLASKYQQTANSSFLKDFYSLPCDWYTTAEESKNLTPEDDLCGVSIKPELLEQLSVSLEKLNHSKGSGFVEVIPGLLKVKSYNPFTKCNNLFCFNSKSTILIETDKEDLLNSEKTHFKPIVEEVIENNISNQYLEKLHYKRGDSGTMFLRNKYGQNENDFEYKVDSSSPSSSPELEFLLKECQTEVLSKTDLPKITEIVCEPNNNLTESNKIDEQNCTCSYNIFDANSCNSCPMHDKTRPDSILGEVVWNYENQICDNCNKKNMWDNNIANNRGWRDRSWTDLGLKDIWNGVEICHTCLNLNSCPTPSSGMHNMLREDISQDGEQLLSDLSHLQKTYMEGLPEKEISCSLYELVKKSDEQKRRHSFIMAGDSNLCVGAPWSFASHIEEDCLIQMSTLPTLRSVTL